MSNHAIALYAARHNRGMRLKKHQIEQIRALARKVRDEQFDGNDSALARAVHVHQSTISRFLKSELGINLDVADRIAQLGQTSIATLLGLGLPAAQREPAPEMSTPSPPASETRVSIDAVEELINDAFDPSRHKPGDVGVVIEALTSHAALLKDQGEPSYLARIFLDAVADARTKGRRLTADELPGAAFGVMKHRLSWAEERIAQFEAEADASLRAKGLEPRDTPHPLLLAAQKRAGITGVGGPK